MDARKWEAPMLFTEMLVFHMFLEQFCLYQLHVDICYNSGLKK